MARPATSCSAVYVRLLCLVLLLHLVIGVVPHVTGYINIITNFFDFIFCSNSSPLQFNPISQNVLIPWVAQGGGGIHPPYGKPPSDYPTLFLLYTVKHTCMRTYHAKVEVPWFKTVELAADQKSDPSARNLENSKNQNLYKENRYLTFSKGRQNLTKAARTL